MEDRRLLAVMAIGDAMVTEGPAGDTAVLSFPVTLSEAAAVDISFEYQTQDGSATAGGDFQGVATPATFTMAAGDVSGSIEITVNGDATVEQDETFELIVGNLQTNGTDVTLAGSGVLVSEGFVDSGQALGSKLSDDVLLGDLDGDGDLDAFAVNRLGSGSSVWLNDGSGTYVDTGQSIGDGNSFDGAMGDVDGDGDLDVLLSNFSGNFGPVAPDQIWLNDGQGTFTAGPELEKWNGGSAVELADIDLDGDLDAITGAGRDDLWINQGGNQSGVEGTFVYTAGAFGSEALITTDISTADVDNDGDIDVVFSYGNGAPIGDNAVYLNQGGTQGGTLGTFALGSTFGPSGLATALELGDLDGDGYVDAFVGRSRAGAYNSQTFPSMVFLNDGAGAFVDTGQALLANPDAPTNDNFKTRDVKLGDVDNDGDLDAFLGNNSAMVVYLNDGLGTFSDSGQRLGTGTDNYSVALGDLDGDGILDAFVGNNGPNSVWINDAEVSVTGTIDNDDLASLEIGDASVVEGNSGTTDLSFPVTLSAPVDVDVSLDYATQDGSAMVADSDYDANTGTLTIIAGDTSGTIKVTVNGDITVEAEETLQIVASNVQAGERSVALVTQQFVDSGQTLGSKLSDDVLLGDLDGDGDLDAFAVNRLGAGHSVWINQGGVQAGVEGDYVDSNQSLGSSNSFDGAIGDIDGDGDLDVLVSNFSGNFDAVAADQIWLNDGQGTFTAGPELEKWNGGSAVELADIDNDGDLDAITGAGLNDLWINQGNDQFGMPIFVRIGTGTNTAFALPQSYNTSDISSADIDHDGDIDVVFSSRNLDHYVFLNQFIESGSIGTPTFVQHSTLNEPIATHLGSSRGYANAIELGDLNGDTYVDAFVTRSRAGAYASDDFPSVVFLYNPDTGFFEDTGQELTANPNQPSSEIFKTRDVKLGDVDNDGDLDAFLANSVSNVVYLNDGSGTFSDSGQLLGTNTDNYSVALGDVDGDGNLDAFVGVNGPNKVWVSEAGIIGTIINDDFSTAPNGTDGSVTTNEDSTYTFTSNDFGFADLDDDAFNGVLITTLPATGTLKLSGAAVSAGDLVTVADIANLTYEPAANVNGSTSFTFQVEDDGGGNNLDLSPNTLTINIASVNDTATVTADTGAVTEDTAVVDGNISTSGSVTVADPDTGEDQAIPQTDTAGTYGTFSVDENGDWTYDADNSQTAIQALSLNATLTDTFVVTSEDGTASNTVTITITGVNDDPKIDNVIGNGGEIEENSPGGTSVGQIVASDVDGDSLTFTPDDPRFVVDEFGNITVAEGADLDYEMDPSITFTVTVNDGHGGVVEQEFTINLLNVTATISGTVFVDTDGDGLFDGGTESAIDGVEVKLLDSALAELASDATELGGVYAFEVDDEFATYMIQEIQPTGVDDGAAILGDANDNGTTGETVDGTVVSSNEMQLTLAGTDASDYDFTEVGQAIQAGDTATIGFWQNKNGQALIKHGGSDLANWLTDNFENVFAATFVGGDGEDVASFYKDEFFKKKLKGTSKVDAQFMATALATFFTSSNLSGGNVATSYGFDVTETGIGTKVVNVGTSGDAFGVDNNTDMTIMSLLLATNSFTDNDGTMNNDDDGYSHVYDANGDGVLDDAETAMRALANDLYTLINEGGDI